MLTLRTSFGRVISMKYCRVRRECSSGSVCAKYDHKVASGDLVYDANQHKILQTLDLVEVNISNFYKSESENTIPIRQRDNLCLHNVEQQQETNCERIVKPQTATRLTSVVREDSTRINVASPIRRPRGIYIWGDVGTGKTLIMDLFFTNSKVSKKRRVHFHKFMLEIHERIHKRKQHLLSEHGRDVQINLSSERDAISYVAKCIAEEASLLCFDEFQVLDICDAMILTKFFGELWAQGTVLVATSNRPPDDLYKDGLNRSYFVPFIRRLEKECVVRQIGGSFDYRMSTSARDNSFFVPNKFSTEPDKRLHEDFNSHAIASIQSLNSTLALKPVFATVPVMMGRHLDVEVLIERRINAVNANADDVAGICYTHFSYLCEGDRGAADFQALCRHFHTVYLQSVPRLSVLEHDKARRFITLVDELYDSNTRLVWSGEAPPVELFRSLSSQEVEECLAAEGGAKLGVDHSWTKAGPRGDGLGSRGGDSAPVNTPREASEMPALSALSGVGPNDDTRNFSVIKKFGVDAAQEELKLLEGELASVQELHFAFRRTASRLTEMAGEEYLLRWRTLRSGHEK